MKMRYVASKVTTLAASAALFGGVTAWIAAAAAGPAAQPADIVRQLGTAAPRVRTAQRTSPTSATAPRPVTRTRAS